MKNQAFTLIELLVVVLIIGILAAIAVPQYQKAVLKSRYTQAMTLLESIWQGEERYQMVHGEYSFSFDDLDIKLPPPLRSSSNTYVYNWGVCYIHGVGYLYCTISIGSEEHVMHARWLGSPIRECWAYPFDNKVANKFCKTMTKKTEGYKWYNATRYSF